MASEEKRLPVYWEGELVGHVVNPQLEGFQLYGDWKPEDADATDEFLASLAVDPEGFETEPLWVGIGETTPKFAVHDLPEEQFSALFDPRT